MRDNEFVHLHNHAHESVLDGFAKNSEYLKRTVELGQPGIGRTDHGNVFGIYTFLQECKSLGIVGVPGSEMYVAPINPEGARVQKPVFYGPGGRKAKFDVSSNGAYLHLTMWAYNSEGLQNLFNLSSLSYQPENNYSKNRIDFEMLEEYNKGLIVSTGCPSSEISTRFLLGQDDKAYEYAGRLKDVFGSERLFVEIMDHSMSIDLERNLLPKQLKLAKDLNIELLATNDCHYTYPNDAKHHEELLCTQSASRMSDPTYEEGGSRFAFQGNEYYLKSAQEMAKIFPHEDFPNAMSNTLKIMEMATDLKVDFNPNLKAKPNLDEGKDEVSYFKELINAGYAERRKNDTPEVKKESKKRIAQEFEVIYSSDFIGYFLTVYEYIKWTRDKYSTKDDEGNILVPATGSGRGSVGGSEIAYLLKISDVDPIKYNLFFERFLTAGRGATYKITYDDGSTEEIVVSGTKHILKDGENTSRYIHQLKVGDEVIIED